MPVLSELIAIVAVSAATLVATSLDNLLLLVGFHASNTIPHRSIALGYGAALIVMIAFAGGLAVAADVGLPFPAGYLGLAPLGFGLYHGVRAFRADAKDGEPSTGGETKRRMAEGFISVFVTMLANSGDSLLVFAALFADTEYSLDVVVLGTVVVMAAMWVWLARWLIRRPSLREPLQGFARFGLPILLIGVGLYILTDTSTDVLTGL